MPREIPQAAPATRAPSRETMAWIPGGVFTMGSDAHYPEEAPAQPVRVDGFWMDRTTVTNAQFRAFVEATGYVTVAERPIDPALYPGADPALLVPASLVFQQPLRRVDLRDWKQWWALVPGADWRHPLGPDSDLEGKDDHPVVHVAFEDAEAYARWVGQELATEAEWERAARGGLEATEFVWGDEAMPEGALAANIWLGEFPWRTDRSDGHIGTMPVASFPPNGFGLFDMAGNVWEWTQTWWSDKHPDKPAKACCIPENPRGGSKHRSYDAHQPMVRIPRKVMKGGSHLCAKNYCYRYRPGARSPEMVDSSACHIGFRCVLHAPGPEEGGAP